MKSTVVAFIFARGGSKGVPRKNIRPLGGKPLIAHAIEAARAAERITEVVVSTEDPEIAEVARHYGAEVPFMRPESLARDDSPEWLAWRHAIETWQALGGRTLDAFVSVPPTSPFRQPGDIDACVDALMRTDAEIVLTVSPAARNPYFNMVRLDADGYAHLPMTGERITRRQDAPPLFDITTVAYAARPPFVLTRQGLFEGRVRTVVVPPERALDIDTELDLKFAEFLLANRELMP